MHCNDNTNGTGCLKCSIACSNAIEQGSEGQPFFDKNFECQCHICACECFVVYFSHEAKKLSQLRRIECEKKLGSMTQPKLNSYFGFKEIITNMAEDRLEAVGSIDDALALTSHDLSVSTTLTHNVPLQNNVQKNIGEI